MSALLKRYGPWVDQGPTSIDHTKVRMRVLAIPQAGMGAWAFHAWQAALPETVELLPVELPGRNSRMLEPKGQSMRQLVTALVDALAETLREKPFVVFGHSLGAWMAYEVCVELGKRRGPQPVGLVVSGARAPQLADPGNDADRVQPRMADLPSRAFWAHFERRYGHNPDLAHPAVKEHVEPLLKADFRLFETYEPRLVSLPYAVVACAAVGDDRVLDAQLEAWRERCDCESDFERRRFDATGPQWSTPHRWPVDDPSVFLEWFGPWVFNEVKAMRYW